MYSLRRKLLKLDKCFIELNVNRIMDCRNMSYKYVRILYACKKLYLNDSVKVIHMENNKKKLYKVQ